MHDLTSPWREILSSGFQGRAIETLDRKVRLERTNDRLTFYPGSVARSVDRANEHIEWNAREIVDAIKRQARLEDTQRWDVVDFPGYDADGEI